MESKIKTRDLVAIDGYFEVVKIHPLLKQAILNVEGLYVVVSLDRLIPAPQPQEESYAPASD